MSTKYIGYFEKNERICVEVLAESPVEAILKLKEAGKNSNSLSGYKLDTSMIYPCGTFDDLNSIDQSKMFKYKYVISKDK